MTPEGLFKVGDPLLPRKPTQEDKNQVELDRIWAEDQEKAKTVEEKNQEKISEVYGIPLPDELSEKDAALLAGQAIHTTEVLTALQKDGATFKPETPMLYCVCGNGYQHQSSLSRHQAKCRKLRGRVNDDGGIR
uniref:C2H2-type domain-containing protein n=1 Tax=viral metagenome TaxID=1070528 RepID=A0A6H1ZS91_9ZZZZ